LVKDVGLVQEAAAVTAGWWKGAWAWVRATAAARPCNALMGGAAEAWLSNEKIRLSNDHLGPLSNGNAAPVGLQWTSAFNLDVPRVHLAKLHRLVSPSGCHRTSLALNWLYKTLLEWV